jgi:hypothetical protein
MHKPGMCSGVTSVRLTPEVFVGVFVHVIEVGDASSARVGGDGIVPTEERDGASDHLVIEGLLLALAWDNL